MKSQNSSITSINHLPNEILLHIFSYASAYDLIKSFQHVCTRWFYVINDSEKIWKGDIRLKGLHRNYSKSEMMELLCNAHKLKYLEINYHYLCDPKVDCSLNKEERLLTYRKLPNLLDFFQNYKSIKSLAHDLDSLKISSKLKKSTISDVSRLICSRNSQIEYLKIYEPHPPFNQLKYLLRNLRNLKRLSVKLFRLNGRVETINELTQLLGEFPDIDIRFQNEITCNWYKISHNQFALAPITSFRYFDE